MPYTTREDIEAAAGGLDRLVQMADWNGDGVPDDEAIAPAQLEADGLIDSYASRRYREPLRNPSPYLVRLAAKETVYQILIARGGSPTTLEHEQHEERVRWLEALARGDVRPSEPLPPKSSAVKNRYQRSKRAVSRDKSKGFW